MSEQPKKPSLRPARLELDEQRAYLPRMPWKWLLLGAIGVTTVATGYSLKQKERADALRAQIVDVHETKLAPAADKVLAFRARLDALITGVSGRVPAQFIDERLKLSGLRSGQGLYLRLPAGQADTPSHIKQAASGMEPDAILRCLGLTASSARALYDRATFLEPDWVEEHRGEDSVMKLRVADEMLAQHIRADLPALLGLLKSDWFLLVLEQGDDRHADPVDVFLWDLRGDQKLLSARVQARGALVPTRIFSQGKHVGAAQQQWQSVGAQDCSIASQLRALDGFPAPEVASALPQPPSGDAPPQGGAQDAVQNGPEDRAQD